MSNTPQGPGWWIASDGKWYPPEQRPAAPPPPPPVAPAAGAGTPPPFGAMGPVQPPGYASTIPPKKSGTNMALIWGLVACGALFVIIVAIGAMVGGRDDESASSSVSTASTTTTQPSTTTTLSVETLRAQLDAEVQRACAAGAASGTGKGTYAGRWAPTGVDSAAFDAMIADCIALAIQAQVESAGTVDVDAVIKNPDAVKGQVFVLVSEISQFDGATGPCAFRGYWDNTVRDYNFEYAGDNAVFSAGDGDTECPVLDGIDQDDVVRVWVKSLGTLSYDTQIGGSTTVPAFQVLKAELISKG